MDWNEGPSEVVEPDCNEVDIVFLSTWTQC